MRSFPYRTAAPRPPEELVAPVDEATRLGRLRSRHAGESLARLLTGPIVVSLLILWGGSWILFLDGYPSVTALVTYLVIAFACSATAFWLLTRGLLWRRDLHIDLHADGLVMHRRGAREVVFFEDVSEVWYELTRHQYGQVLIPRLRVMEFSGASHRVPLTGQEPLAILSAIQRRCSDPLLPEARKALSEGETLTFGRARLDRDGITIGAATASWSELRLVRLQPGQASFFRRRPLLPWRTVGHDTVPHPSVFLRLVTELAPRVEEDDSLTKLLR